MSDTKELTWGDAAQNDHTDATPVIETDQGSLETATRSWDAYRNWLSRAPAPSAKARPALDPTVYTWKGYRNWSDKVKRNWSDRTEKD
ncbi:MAG: hypothetical protein AAF385_07665 [Pseudomonadota bacterium]